MRLSKETLDEIANYLQESDFQENPPKLYIRLYVENVKELQKYLKSIGVSPVLITETGLTDDFHCTLVWSKEFLLNITNNEQKDSLDFPLENQVIGFELFGDNEDVLVMKLEKTEEIMSLQKRYKEIYEAHSKYPTYEPHVTISYNSVVPKSELNQIKLPNFKIKFKPQVNITVYDNE